MTSSDWSDIGERLARLAADADGVFGADSHGWLLEPPLSTAELSEIEERLRVKLPGEYRSFLLKAGVASTGVARAPEV